MGRITDGLGTTIAFALASGASFSLEQLRLSAPGVDGGEMIPVTHLGNTVWRTKVPKTLKDFTPFDFEAHWDPSQHISAPINQNVLITLTFPAGDKFEFYGVLRVLTPGDIVEGDKVNSTGTIEPSLVNPTTGAETAPTYTAAP